MIATSLVWLTAGVSTAGAQIAETFQELSQLVGPGESVSVTDGHGAISRGRIFDLTDSSFRLRTGSATREFSRADVREIQRRHDSLVNGALIGLASGSAVAAILASGVCNSSGFFRTECTPSGVVLTMGALGGIGAGIGVAMDALVVGTRTIYRAPGGTEVVIRVQPLFGAHRVGAFVSLSARGRK